MARKSSSGTEGSQGGDAAALAERVLAGERAAISAALNRVDDNRPSHRGERLALLDALEGRTQKRGVRIGVTGAPGAGKSTLLDALVSGLRELDRSVGVLAVDPSSQRTGGALLGDRMRLGASARDAGVFMRSLAARDRLGGLSEITGPSLDVLAAAYDYVFVETVGVGQSETEVTSLVDTLLFVAQPAAGDLIQFMKAGILEWPDLFFVNKSDLGAVASRAVAELRAGLDLGSRRDPDYEPQVLSGSARDQIGIDEIIDALDDHAAHLARTNQLSARREAGRIARVHSALDARYGRYGLNALRRVLALPASTKPLRPDDPGLEAWIRARPKRSVDALAFELGTEIEATLSGQSS